MGKYIRKRLIQLIPILIGITLLSFILTNLSSTDAIDVMESSRGVAMSEQEKEQLREDDRWRQTGREFDGCGR